MRNAHHYTMGELATFQYSVSMKNKCPQQRLVDFYQQGKIEELESLVKDHIDSSTFDIQALVELAKLDKDAAGLAKKVINSHSIEDNELADLVAKEIIADIEEYVEEKLKKFPKYNLNAWQVVQSDVDDSTSKFFNLISLLKDVSILGRKLLESSPQFKSLQSPNVPVSLNSLADRKSLLSQKTKCSKDSLDGDATSDDLLAALIESSSSDDFLILSSSLESISNQDMILESLILIKSHECFTLSHDIQGVVMVLKRTKFMILNILAPKNQMDLITKLLTSISRYNEMNYVFDLFRDSNQFEILLSKGVKKTPDLRIALFNYVKKNPEFYPLVTLNFSMFREIAESLEASAINRLNKISQVNKKADVSKRTSICIPRTNSHEQFNSSPLVVGMPTSPPNLSINCSEPSSKQDASSISNESTILPLSKDSLNLCLIELVDAADCFAKAGSYKRSHNCENRAKLIALQLALLPGCNNLLNLQQSELSDLIVSFELFPEAFIVAEAYDYHLAWRQAVFKNVILCADQTSARNYLNEFCSRCDLSETLVFELVFLYKQQYSENSRDSNEEDNARMAESMKMILSKLTNVGQQFKIYTQLNFNDSKDELLKDPATRAYLKDLRLA